MGQIDTKTHILDVAQDLIRRLGVSGMSYKDVSEAVGIRKASVHTHFPKKDDLLVAVLDRYSDRLLRTVDSIIDSPESAEVKLRRYCSLFEATLSSGNQDRVCLGGIVGTELISLSPLLAERIRTFYQESEARIAAMLTEGRQTGEFSFKGDSDVLASLVFSALQGGLLIARVRGGAQTFHATVDQLMTLVKGG